jgi:hypothetical protein
MLPADVLPALERQHSALLRALVAATDSPVGIDQGDDGVSASVERQVSSGVQPLERLQFLEKENTTLREELTNVQGQVKILREKERNSDPDGELNEEDKVDDNDEIDESDPFSVVGIVSAYVADFRLNAYPPGTSTSSSAAVLECEKDQSSFLYLPQGVYLKCEFGTALGKVEGHLHTYTVSMDVKLELTGADDTSVSLFSLGWPAPKPDLDVIITPGGIVRTPLDEFSLAGDELVKVPSNKWCRICVTVSEHDNQIATYVDGEPVGTVEDPCVSATSGRFSMNARGFLVFAAESSTSSQPVRVRRVEVHRKAMTAEQVKEVARKHWILSEEVRAMTCLSAVQKLKRLSLYGVLTGTRTVPIWKHPAFLGIFTDRYNAMMRRYLFDPCNVPMYSYTA